MLEEIKVQFQHQYILVRIDWYQPEIKPLPFGPHDGHNADPGQSREIEYKILAVDGEKPEADDLKFLEGNTDFENAIENEYQELEKYQ